MRGRPSLPLGKHGDIWTRREGKTYTAYCYYRDTDGVTRRVKASAPKAEQARIRLQERLASRSYSASGELSPDSTVAQLAETWIKQIVVSPDGSEGVRQATKDRYVQQTRKHILPALGNLRLREITVGRVEDFLNSKRDMPAAARVCRSILKLMFAFAARLDAVPANIVSDTTPVKTKSEVKAMPWEDVERFRAHIAGWAGDREDRAYVVDITDLFIATGLRPGELLGLLWTDIDFKERTLTVTGTLKTDSVSGFHRQPFPKSKAGERTVVLPEFVWPMLARRKLAASCEKVFPGRDGVSWRHPANFHHTWKAARGDEWAHVKQKDFRTAVATMISRQSGSMAAAGQLGHSSDVVTRKHYIEAEKKTQDNSVVWGRLLGES
jgi:integrase